MNRPRAADDFATIRARMEELRREREGAAAVNVSGSEPAPARVSKGGRVLIALLSGRGKERPRD
jgi:hypothetical protein